MAYHWFREARAHDTWFFPEAFFTVLGGCQVTLYLNGQKSKTICAGFRGDRLPQTWDPGFLTPPEACVMAQMRTPVNSHPRTLLFIQQILTEPLTRARHSLVLLT